MKQNRPVDNNRRPVTPKVVTFKLGWPVAKQNSSTEINEVVMEELLTISYRSFARLREPVGQINSILLESRYRNQQLGITGLLLFDGTYFMQTIEGPPRETRTVFVQIASDKRHAEVVPFGIATNLKARLSWLANEVDRP